MPLGWDTDILNHTSANGIYHFKMVYFLIKKNKVIKTCLESYSSKRQSQDLNLFCQTYKVLPVERSTESFVLFCFKYILMKTFQKWNIHFHRFKNREK